MKKKPSTSIRKDIRAAIDKLYPDGIIEWTVSPDESYIYEKIGDVTRRLSAIEDASLLRVIDPLDRPEQSHRYDLDDDEHEPIPDDSPMPSYFVFFVGLKGKDARFDHDGAEPDDDGEMHDFHAIGTVGCTVGISLLAPFAYVKLGEVLDYDDGNQTEPDIWPDVYELDGTPRDLVEHYDELMDSGPVARMQALRESIELALKAEGITVVPDEEATKRVPGLKAEDEVIICSDSGSRTATVLDAFFFLTM